MVFLVVIAAAVLLYFTVGLRLGYVTLMPTQLYNANGQNHYGFEAFEDNQSVGVTGTCRVREGRAVLRLLDPSGKQVATQTCVPGVWSLQLTGYGQQGFYKLYINFDRYTGVMDLNESRNTVKR
ncbi:hypothetical protein SAMN00790413_01190 [Deinococcus hopiensis KR-140]|uniref:Uncharacterized protein n=1 Tax=Deinococcus hopiensis KR-140 TaxID=695939 RepID=A0A1W1VDV8_9DEIO|nr:hypothetical protein SAMN00790413_01190 [Deinococcus hopiensis KR-140]